MPKRKAEPIPPPPTFAATTRSRRAASKEALKQMQILLDDEDEDNEAMEIPSDDDLVAIEPPPVRVPSPPKKKYKLSHRKSSDGHDRDVLVLKSISNHVNTENTLELDCWVEELSDVQKEMKKKYDEECKALEEKLKSIIKTSNVSTVHKSELSSAYEIEPPPQPPPPAPPQSNIILQNSPGAQSYQLVMDPRLGLIVAGAVPVSAGAASSSQPPPLAAPLKTYMKGKVQISRAVKDVANATAKEDDGPPARQTRTRSRQSGGKPAPSPSTSAAASPIVTRGGAHPKQTAAAAATTTATAGAKVPAVGAKTPPLSKIVLPKPAGAPVTRLRGVPTTTASPPPGNARPTESNVEGGLVAGTSRRSPMVDLTEDSLNQADSKEIAFSKLQGKTYPSLVIVARPHMRVKDLTTDRGKLDTKVKSVLMHPPTKFTEWLIQQGLVRSEQKCSLHTTSQLKLGMYSDVSKFPYSGGYVWISECCPQRFVSVFSGSLFEGSPHPPIVILKLLYHWSCQTNIQNVTQWVKVDNLYVKGLYTWLRAVCTVGIHTHIRQMGGPGAKVEVGVISLGTTSQDGNQRQVKVEVLGIMETSTKFLRLRAVEPDLDKNYKKRFNKILEPVMHWVHPASIIITDLTVDKSTLTAMGFGHVVQSTSTEYGSSNRMIMEYLRQVVPRMFQNTLSLLSRQIIQQFLDELVWREWFGTTNAQAFDNIVVHLAEQTRADMGCSLITRLNRVAALPFKSWALTNTANFTVGKANNATVPPLAAAGTADTNTGRTYGRPRKPIPSPTSRTYSPPPRPAKSSSPDVPEQMVPLENYYYGTIDGATQPPQERVTLNMKCPYCKVTLNNNIGLMHHLFKHAHNVSGETRLCRYCLTGVPNNTDLMNHIATSHPSETKFDNGFVCLICETQFMNPFILGKHMSREHCPYELPYQCGSCTHRCSNHKQAIDHFYKMHSNGPVIQCPFCLKTTLLVSSGRQLVQNMNYFIQHLQKHQKKQIAKRCGKCNLWFIQKDLLKDHQTKMHVSQRGKPHLVPWTAPRNCVMVPKSKIDEVPDDELINYSSLHFSVTKNLICKECDMCLDSPKHLSSFESCSNQNCQYSTCCANAMKKHNETCKVLNETLPKEPLPYIMFCICGFSSNDGNVLAKHLAICEKKSAYPSRASANKAMVKQSMLDVLGLVRKPEESQIAEEKTQKPTQNLPQKSLPRPETISLDEDEAMKSNEKSNKTDIGVEKSSTEENKKEESQDLPKDDSKVAAEEEAKVEEKQDLADDSSSAIKTKESSEEIVDKDENLQENDVDAMDIDDDKKTAEDAPTDNDEKHNEDEEMVDSKQGSNEDELPVKDTDKITEDLIEDDTKETNKEAESLENTDETPKDQHDNEVSPNKEIDEEGTPAKSDDELLKDSSDADDPNKEKEINEENTLEDTTGILNDALDEEATGGVSRTSEDNDMNMAVKESDEPNKDCAADSVSDKDEEDADDNATAEENDEPKTDCATLTENAELCTDEEMSEPICDTEKADKTDLVNSVSESECNVTNTHAAPLEVPQEDATSPKSPAEQSPNPAMNVESPANNSDKLREKSQSPASNLDESLDDKEDEELDKEISQSPKPDTVSPKEVAAEESPNLEETVKEKVESPVMSAESDAEEVDDKVTEQKLDDASVEADQMETSEMLDDSEDPSDPVDKARCKNDEIPDIQAVTIDDETPDIQAETKDDEVPDVQAATKDDEISDVQVATKQDEIQDVQTATKDDEIPDVEAATRDDEIPDVEAATRDDEIPDIQAATKLSTAAVEESCTDLTENNVGDDSRTHNNRGGGSAMHYEPTEENMDSVVSQSVLDTLAAECANTAKSSLINSEELEKMDVDPTDISSGYSLVESETPMDIN